MTEPRTFVEATSVHVNVASAADGPASAERSEATPLPLSMSIISPASMLVAMTPFLLPLWQGAASTVQPLNSIETSLNRFGNASWPLPLAEVHLTSMWAPPGNAPLPDAGMITCRVAAPPFALKPLPLPMLGMSSYLPSVVGLTAVHALSVYLPVFLGSVLTQA